jgi:hypothetical protein
MEKIKAAISDSDEEEDDEFSRADIEKMTVPVKTKESTGKKDTYK